MKKPIISVIIPTLNEEDYLRKTVNAVLNNSLKVDALEIIVVDAGSTDRTYETVKDLPIKWFSKPEFVLKKYLSLNFGIQQSTGETLLFLDADTILPKRYDQHIHKALSRKDVVGGAFEFSFYPVDWKLKMIQAANRLRYRIERIYYGDQAIFCKREIALEVDGFPQEKLMDAAYFCRRIKKLGKLRLIKEPIETSSRRFNDHGYFKVLWFDFSRWFLFFFHFPVSKRGEEYWSYSLNPNE